MMSQNETPLPRCKKCLVVGDSGVGKSPLLHTYFTGMFPTETAPFQFQKTPYEVKFLEKHICLDLWDSSGCDDYDRLRFLEYEGVDVVIICFAINNRDSADNVRSKWFPEVRSHARHAHVILVGTKLDLRLQADVISLGQFVSKKEGKSLAKTIRALKYFECSALHNLGLREVIEYLAKASLRRRKKQMKYPTHCAVL
ncbi:ras-related protein ced-10-like isoform X2 [Physella acuta]|uniref:ras-related protein ced-10-like isoform X1 n=1 Tax=Physella acuta TaxID=109671 RepID=UPI0027DD5639|nr:ras-related protein ced-10-like isoform X1 [Physella acuta]XP_059165193.1 ras-related protein ced-10-like isoform X2 [Physella acuta]